MLTKATLQHQESRPFWRAGVCVLLIGLVLYNPFLVLNNLNIGLSYRTLARNRATVGSSELQHFSPTRNQSEQPAIAVLSAVACITPVVAAEGERRISRQAEAELPCQPELVSRVWFRPPPTP